MHPVEKRTFSLHLTKMQGFTDRAFGYIIMFIIVTTVALFPFAQLYLLTPNHKSQTKSPYHLVYQHLRFPIQTSRGCTSSVVIGYRLLSPTESKCFYKTKIFVSYGLLQRDSRLGQAVSSSL